eukprot:COSAG01_NODE_3642_length_5836_cov_6.885132_4_plen_79_part_00
MLTDGMGVGGTVEGEVAERIRRCDRHARPGHSRLHVRQRCWLEDAHVGTIILIHPKIDPLGIMCMRFCVVVGGEGGMM